LRPREGAELAKQFIEGSFATERISPAATGGFQKRDRVRFVIYSSFDNHPGSGGLSPHSHFSGQE